MLIRPKVGLLVRDPVTKQFLPAEGREVEDSLYWQRRLIDGDVETIPSSPASGAAAREGDPSRARRRAEKNEGAIE